MRHGRFQLWFSTALIALCACTSDETTLAASCDPPNRVIDGMCLEPAVQDDGCPAASHLIDDGTCQPAGIPPAMCGEGFEPTGDMACNAILPAGVCPKGTMALPGETACREVMPCGAGRWGEIPTEPTTVYVDQSYDGGASDGSEATPFTTISAAVAAASPGGQVAIAAGSYFEDVLLQGKAVRLWGTCPAQVEIIGTGAMLGTVNILEGASGSEVHALAVTGGFLGISTTNAEDLLVDRVWIHDVPMVGLDAEDSLGPSSVTVQGSLIEDNHAFGLALLGANGSIDSVVVRGTLPQPSDQARGRGIEVDDNPSTNSAVTVTLRNVVVELNHEFGVFARGGTVDIEAVVVRDTLPRAADGTFGRGINSQDLDAYQGVLNVRASVIERNHAEGVSLFGVDATFEHVVIRDTQLSPDGSSGRGIISQHYLEVDQTSAINIISSVIERNHQIGVFAGGTDINLASVIIRDTLPQLSSVTDPTAGRGIHVQRSVGLGAPTHLTVQHSLIERNVDTAVTVFESEASFDGVAILQTAAADDGNFGDGITVFGNGAHVTITACAIENNARAGLAILGANAELGQSFVACNAIDLVADPYNDNPAMLINAGQNQCGCPDQAATDSVCKALSANLLPPATLEESM